MSNVTAPQPARRLTAGTRGSELARRQTDEALAPLRAARPDLEIEVTVVRTAGDRDQRTPLSVLGGQGIFATELERALLDGRIDLAVHSLKDLPPRLASGLTILAIPPREDPSDALVSRGSLPLAGLAAGARVGTGSARRRALLLRLRPDLSVVEVRGNVETRIVRVREGALDAVVLAAAGLRRLGRLDEAAEIFPPQLMIPAPGQGALAIEARLDDPMLAQIAPVLDDPPSHLCARVERAFLARLGSGCTAPVGAYASLAGDTIKLQAFIASADGGSIQTASLEGPAEAAESLGVQLAETLLAAGDLA